MKEILSFGLTYDPKTDSLFEEDYRQWKIACKVADIKLEDGGMVVLSTDVNATAGQVKSVIKKFMSKVKSWFRSIWQRFRKEEMVDVTMEELLKEKGISTGWSIGNLFNGRYYDAETDTLYSEKSFSVEVLGVPFDFIEELGQMLGKKFKQKQVIVVDYKSNGRYLMDVKSGKKERVRT